MSKPKPSKPGAYKRRSMTKLKKAIEYETKDGRLVRTYWVRPPKRRVSTPDEVVNKTSESTPTLESTPEAAPTA